MWIHEAFLNKVEDILIKEYFDTEKSCRDERVTSSKDYESKYPSVVREQK